MGGKDVSVRELAGWRLDDYEYRTKKIENAKLACATRLVAQRSPLQQENIVLATESSMLHDSLINQSSRLDLLDEMKGLEWSLGVVDLRSLVAFQRRISFHPEHPLPESPAATDWPALLALSFGPAKSVQCEMEQDAENRTILLHSDNPNLYLRATVDATSPLSVHAGGPFFEVACYRGRWFLRDGYHRAYALLRSGIFKVPAVIVQARTIEELGATQPWFFSEEVLFSDTPPCVIDFLDNELVLEYARPRLIKTLRITMEEILSPVTSKGEQV